MDTNGLRADGGEHPALPLGLPGASFVRKIRRQGAGLAVALPPEVLAHLEIGAGEHLYFALGDAGLVMLARVSTLPNVAAATITLSERLAARESLILRLRRKLRGARDAAFARGVNHGYMLGLRDGLREEPLSSSSSPS
jgi:antitoxin component of MazEF toxin-antitoxin module